MTIDTIHLSAMSDDELVTNVKALARDERVATVQLIASLAELDARKLYLGEGYSSLFTYCTQALHLSEHAAYGRIEAARVSRRFPVIVELLRDGAVTLTTIGLLAPLLTSENHQELLTAGRHKSKREVQEIIARWRPQAPVASSVCKLPQPARPLPSELPTIVAGSADDGDYRPRGSYAPIPTPSASRPVNVTPLAPERYKVQMTITRETRDKLQQVQDLLRHQLPNGDPAVIFDRALTMLLNELKRMKCGATTCRRDTTTSAVKSRHIPAAVRRAVWARDEGRCAFVGSDGRCAERGFLEYHHVVPFADGGTATVENVQLRCRAHNALEDARWNGPADAFLLREGPCGFEELTR